MMNHTVMDEKQALDMARSWCSRREYCSYGLARKLSDLSLDAETVSRMLQILREEQFVDDRRYGAGYVNDKWRFNHWGERKIKYMLQQQGFTPNEIQEAWATVDLSEYRHMVAEVLRRKWADMKRGTVYEKKARLLRFAAGRGYDPEWVHVVVEQDLER